MAVPGKVANAGNNSVAQNVFKVVFSQATSNAPSLQAWDDANFNTVTHQIFTGTTANGNIPMISAVGTTDGAPSSNWKPVSAAAGGATANRLKGNTNYVNLSSNPVNAGGNVRFNICWEIPSDLTVPPSPSNNLDAVLIIVYSYSGAAPILSWYFNDYGAGGTENVPVWTAIVSGVSGNIIRPADAGCSSSGIVLHKPVSSVMDNPELWVAAS